jgi:hypothetical protein
MCCSCWITFTFRLKNECTYSAKSWID